MQPLVLGGLDALADALTSLKGLFVVTFLVTTITAMGARLAPGDVRRTITEYNLVARWLLANMLFVPLLAVLLGTIFGLSTPIRLGLILVAVAPGAPFIPLLATLAGEDSRGALRLTAALTVVAAVAVPLLTAGVLLLLGVEQRFSPWRFLLPLVLILVFPLALGVALRWTTPALADRLTGPLDTIANLALLVALVLVVVLDPGAITRAILSLLGTGTLLVFVAFVLGSIAIGWLVGGPTTQGRRVLALGTGGRNIGIALFIAVSAFPEADADAGILAFTTLMFAVSLLVAWYWGRKSRTATSPAGDETPLTEP